MSTSLIKNEILPGSVADTAQKEGRSVAAQMVRVEAVVLGDNSGSMETEDIPYKGGKISREQKLMMELASIYKQHPGRVLLVEFSDKAEMRPSGTFSGQHGGTLLAPALELVKDLDDTGVQFIIISDGLAGDEDKALRIAKGFKTKIDTVYVGPESGSDAREGRKFLRSLATASGGRFDVKPQVDVGPNIEMLFLTDGGAR